MEYFSLLDTSLDLNINPTRLIDETQTSALVEELKRVNAENKRLTEMLTVMCENYTALRNQLLEYRSKNPVAEQVVSRKRKVESTATAATIHPTNNIVNNSESSSTDEEYSCKKEREEHVKAKISRVYVKTEASDTSLVVKDGYQWRKYGQKVTKDNPCPRAYFKCSFAPSCPVKKKVQRSAEDQSVLVATYEGEHNHLRPSTLEAMPSSDRCMTLNSVPCTTSLSSSSGPTTITLDLTKPSNPTPNDAKTATQTVNSPEFQQFLAKQMAYSLTKDPGFKAALAAAMSGRIVDNQTAKW
ncbi:WRKY transcription factor [Actinidia chinensis var. chinensis]|uniref:WRKY transcription factor n=1 Tax=Actinidia chinensis var. chinensis TaxID=1590841 RepID=A0A2R6PUW4_ACTCC|nr:WRKY transcription factor [Actinidia chinensis var. chinensis]